eukprot:CAMPEP_0197644764 /NCGR_PEP_ID=MMETSP1338-20131121/17635_1 /TAXON_ID=43686 ORGANISM="Pelagodinium beii, Strain RCC1491" /NCGR_SAMPLE_ID=MMETSP1338 /ASSEMBLY_ACC=CAM_ASM_000754 /LENGTH=64 /DNA_ID=CAMNT_0043218217 /DNA_START=710 /DNA_END=904 /DNA_ORIENTATION=-
MAQLCRHCMGMSGSPASQRTSVASPAASPASSEDFAVCLKALLASGTATRSPKKARRRERIIKQ